MDLSYMPVPRVTYVATKERAGTEEFLGHLCSFDIFHHRVGSGFRPRVLGPSLEQFRVFVACDNVNI